MRLFEVDATLGELDCEICLRRASAHLVVGDNLRAADWERGNLVSRMVVCQACMPKVRELGALIGSECEE